jgi:hypothetical protein
MEIHKLEKTTPDPEDKKPVLKEKPDRDPNAFSLRESWEQLPKGRLLTYGAIILMLLTASIVYNIYQIQKASSPFVMGVPDSWEELSVEFYNLCSDIEEHKEEFGDYPESIRDMLFSNNLMYRRLPDDSFRLVYDDGANTLTFDSKRDIDVIR